jgi:hypothetical protein
MSLGKTAGRSPCALDWSRRRDRHPLSAEQLLDERFSRETEVLGYVGQDPGSPCSMVVNRRWLPVWRVNR